MSDYTTVANGVYVSKMDQFCEAANVCCLHCINAKRCSECSSLIPAAQLVQMEGVCLLSSVFRTAFPRASYTSEKAKQRLVKIPLACIRVGHPTSGTSELILMEQVKGAD